MDDPLRLLLALPFICFGLAAVFKILQALWVEWRGGPGKPHAVGPIGLTKGPSPPPYATRAVDHRWHRPDSPKPPKVRPAKTKEGASQK